MIKSKASQPLFSYWKYNEHDVLIAASEGLCNYEKMHDLFTHFTLQHFHAEIIFLEIW